MTIRAIVWAGIACVFTSTAVGWAEPDDKAKPATCAVLTDSTADPGRAPALALIEERLLARDDLAFVERAEIDKVLGEQRLQKLLGPEAGPQRATAGKLLKADLMILLRVDVREKKPTLEVAVSETRHGLRLATHAIPLSRGVDAVIPLVERLVDQGLRKQGEDINRLFAVPPFVSNDLSWRHDDLKGSYARFIEEMLLRLRGVLVVELDEARAISRERELADGPDRTGRPLPVYVLGEYRDEGEGPLRKVTLDLALSRAGERLGGIRGDGLAPDKVPDFLRDAVNKLTRGLVAGAGPAADPEIEARQLAERADEFRRVGDWSEALALVEASLLLKPDQPTLHRVAAELLDQLAREVGFDPGQSGGERDRLSYESYRRGLDHVEPYLRAARFRLGDPWYIGGPPNPFFDQKIDQSGDPDFRIEYVREKREMLLRVLRARVREGTNDAFLDNLGLAMPWRNGDETEDAAWAFMGRVVEEIRDLPGLERRVVGYAHHGYALSAVNGEKLRAFIAQLAHSSSPKVRDASAYLTRSLEGDLVADLKRRELLAPKAPEVPGNDLPRAVADATQDVVFRPLKLDWGDPQGEGGTLTYLSGCLPSGPGLDVIWSRGHGLFLMRERGRPRLVYPQPHVAISRVCFDGRYIWAVVPGGGEPKPPYLVVIDPETERRREIRAEDGLPFPTDKGPEAYSYSLAVAPIGPGEVGVVGSFGRTFVARVTFDPNAGPGVKVILEARQVVLHGEEGRWSSLRAAFRPAYMFAIGGEAGGPEPSRRFLIGRDGGGPEFLGHPLLIDPATGAAEVVKEPFKVYDPESFVLHEGAIYWIEYVDRGNLALVRFGFPEPGKRLVAQNGPEGKLVFVGERAQIVGKRWWTIEPGRGGVQVAAERVPWYYTNLFVGADGKPDTTRGGPEDPRLEGVYPSEHYGALVVTNTNAGRATILQADIRAPRSGRPAIDLARPEPAPRVVEPVDFTEPRPPHVIRVLPIRGEEQDRGAWIELPGYDYLGSPRFSPDGRWIAFDAYNNEVRETGECYVVRRDGTGLASLGIGSSPTWAPDGKSILFAIDSRTVAERDQGVFAVNRDGTGKRRICAGRWPEWSPDGKRIAFSRTLQSGDDGVRGGSTVYIANADGSGAKPIAEGDAPSWSPDGSRISSCQRDPRYPMPVIRVVDLETGRQEIVGYGWYRGNWLPDGKSLVVNGSPAPGEKAMVRLSADGWKPPESLLPAFKFPGRSPCPAPDGKALAFTTELRAKGP